MLMVCSPWLVFLTPQTLHTTGCDVKGSSRDDLPAAPPAAGAQEENACSNHRVGGRRRRFESVPRIIGPPDFAILSAIAEGLISKEGGPWKPHLFDGQQVDLMTLHRLDDFGLIDTSIGVPPMLTPFGWRVLNAWLEWPVDWPQTWNLDE